MNWTITDGDIYVSKNGDDVTGDGSMSLPYASLNKGFIELGETEKIVIGSGKWEESISSSPTTFTMEGDGKVILNKGTSWFTVSGAYKYWTINNLKITGYVTDACFYAYNSHGKITANNCYFEYSAVIFYTYSDAIGIFNKCTFFNGTTLSIGDIRYAYFTNCNIVNAIGEYFTNKNTYTNCSINYSNVNGIFENCNFYESTISGINASYISNVTFNCIFSDPKFNNESIGDYTLQLDSPCLFAGKNNAHIGAYGVGYNFTSNSSEFTEEGGATFSQSDVGSGLENDIVKYSANIKGVDYYYFVLNTDHTEGTVESEWIDFQTLYELKAANLFANFIYDEDGIATGRVDMDNNNTGEFPNQYDFEMKYCINEDDKDTATWQETIWNKELSNVSARFVKVKIYLKEN